MRSDIQGLSFPIMSFPTTPRNAASSPSCKDNIQWFSPSAGRFLPKDRRQAEGLVELHRELEVAYCRLVTISPDNITLTMNIAAESVPAGLSFPTPGISSKKISTSPNTLILSTIPCPPRDCPRARSCHL